MASFGFSFFQGLLSSPTQAANTFSQFGGFPRQRNVFLVRFILNGQGQGQTSGRDNMQYLSFAAKSIDRPKVNPKTEELNEYNKRRQVFTGYKLEQIRVQFYDSADGAAQNMWTRYARYYFGDFNAGSWQSYSYPDATAPEFRDSTGKGFGFTAANGGASDEGAQFFFQRIELYHFYDNMVDRYDLINPRITAFEPDDLDYENSAVSLVNATFVYENLQYYPQLPVAAGNFWEFTSGPFYGNALPVADAGFPFASASDFNTDMFPSNPFVGSLLGGPVGSIGAVADFRFGSKRSGGALGLFGNFSFGPGGVSTEFGLNAAAFSNSGLGAALSMGARSSPLGTTSSVLFNAQAQAWRGIDGATFDYMAGQASSVNSGYGTVTNQITSGLLASAAMRGGPSRYNNGVVYDPQVYGAINARQTGTAQYGYNVQTTPDGMSFGSTGPNGYMGPTGGPNDGPYNGYQPAGIDGRYVTQEDLPLLY